MADSAANVQCSFCVSTLCFYSVFLLFVFLLFVFPLVCILTWWDLADCCWVPAVALVAVGRLDENGTVTKALSKHLATNVVQPHSSSWETRAQFGVRSERPSATPGRWVGRGTANLRSWQSSEGSWTMNDGNENQLRAVLQPHWAAQCHHLPACLLQTAMALIPLYECTVDCWSTYAFQPFLNHHSCSFIYLITDLELNYPVFPNSCLFLETVFVYKDKHTLPIRVYTHYWNLS